MNNENTVAEYKILELFKWKYSALITYALIGVDETDKSLSTTNKGLSSLYGF